MIPKHPQNLHKVWENDLRTSESSRKIPWFILTVRIYMGEGGGYGQYGLGGVGRRRDNG